MESNIIEFWKTNENPITCYSSRKQTEVIPKRVPEKKTNRQSVPVTIVSQSGIKQEFESVRKAADAVGMDPTTLSSFLNGRARNRTEYTIYKSQIKN